MAGGAPDASPRAAPAGGRGSRPAIRDHWSRRARRTPRPGTARRPATARRPRSVPAKGRRWAWSPISMMSSHSWRSAREIVQLPSTVMCTRITRMPRSCTSRDHLGEVFLALTTSASLIARFLARVVRSRWISLSTPSRRPGLIRPSRSLSAGQVGERSRARNCGGPRPWPRTSSTAAAAGRYDPGPRSRGTWSSPA